MPFRFLFTVLLCICCCVAFPQTVIPRFENIGVDQGLSQSSVYSIYQDRRGFMWFGTADGLNRYDGNSIKVFKLDPNKVKQANSNFIRGSITEDRQGNIWYSNETGIYYYSVLADEIIPAYFFTKEQGQGYLFECIDIDKNGTLWLSNPWVGIFSFETRTGKLNQYPVPANMKSTTNFSEVVLDPQGKIWILYKIEQGLCCFDTHTKTYSQFLEGRQHYHRRLVKDSLVYLMSFKGRNNYELDVYSQDMKLKETISFPVFGERDFSFVSFQVDFLGRIWLTTMSQGLVMYDPKKKRFFQYTHDNSKLKSLPINYTRCMYEDVHHNMWIGTDGGGISKLDLKPVKFNLFPLNEGEYPFLKDYFVKCFYEDKEQNVWFGTLSNGICRFNPASGALDTVGSITPRKGRLCTDVTGAFFEDSKQRLWVGSSMGIGIYQPGENDFLPIEVDPRFQLWPFNIFVYQITELSDGSLLAATSQGLSHIVQNANGRWKATFPENDFASLNTVTAVKEVAPGEIWYTSPINGIFHCRYENGKLKLIQKFLTNTDLRSIHLDDEDPLTIWIASGIGLVRLNTKTNATTIYGTESGLHNSYIYGILEDDQHNLWMSTNGGISVFNKGKASFTNYTGIDGLQSNEFNTGAWYKGASGNFYFGGIRGFNWFRPSALIPNSASPKTAISRLWINDTVLKNDSLYFYTGSLHLPYFKNDLQFEIATLDFTRPEANKVEYQLKGWDDQPVTTYNRQIRYSNLLPGNYQFSYRVCNVDGIWSEVSTINILITPPFWKTWWFYVLLTILALGAAIMITRSVTQRKLRKQLQELEKNRAIEAERNRISKDMHDEIGSGLTHIALMTELMQTQKKADGELKKDAGNISISARKLVESMSEIIWALNPKNDTLENLVAYLREQTVGYFEPFDIHYSIDFPDELPRIKLSNEQRRNLFLVAKEALNNALKHSGASHICFHLKLEEQKLQFHIADNGKGFEGTKARVSSNGLKNMNRRMEDIGGGFELETKNSGTGIRFWIPVPPVPLKGELRS